MAGSRLNGFQQKDAYKSLPYYHDDFKSTEEVASYIKKKGKGKHGHFLLRPSTRNNNILTASILVQDNSVRHTHIQIEENGNDTYKYFLVVEKKFSSVQELIEFYRINPVKNLENVNNVYFMNPLNRHGYSNGSSGSAQIISRSSSVTSVNSAQSTTTWGRDEASTHGSIKGHDVNRVPPPLPSRSRTLSNSVESSGGTAESSGTSINSLQKYDSIARRPPAPLPPHASTSTNGDDTYCYSRARDVSEDVSEKLKDALKSSERCECGIPRNLAELPLGWTVHLSKDEQTYGRLFYQNEEGTTSWNLPQSVRMQLTKKHHENLKLIDKNWCLSPKKGSAQHM